MKRVIHEDVHFTQFFNHDNETLIYVYHDDGEYAFGYGRQTLAERCKQADALAWA